MQKRTYGDIDKFIEQLRATLKRGEEKYGTEYLRQNQAAYIKEKLARIGNEGKDKALEDIVEVSGYAYLWWEKLYTGYTPSVGALSSLTGETANILQEENLIYMACTIQRHKYSIKFQFEYADKMFSLNDIKHVLLLGCMFKVPDWFLAKYDTYNLHPGVLPAQAGKDPHKLALQQGYAGVTIHKVTSAIDQGEVLAQMPVPVHLDDTEETLYLRLKRSGLELTRMFIRSYLT